jgi:hypothetical protein
MLIGFFVFQTFKEDNPEAILPLSSYATTGVAPSDRYRGQNRAYR